MSERVCIVPECTYPQTGVCMKSFAPDACPSHRAALEQLAAGHERARASEDEQNERAPDAADLISGDPVLQAPHEKPSLPRSGTLGLTETGALMATRYVNVIGVVGLPNAGKTASIVSLYLMLAHGSLDGFSFAGSSTLMALEEISRGARRWSDGTPTEMTLHTEVADDRQAGFLHLRLRRDIDNKKFDVVVPDIPGEWTRSLIDSGEAHRFDFLKSAEVVWLMVDGREFLELRTRELAIHRLTLLIERLTSILVTPRPRVILVASWRDKGDFPADALDRITSHATEFGLILSFASIASFSDDDDVQPGAGLSNLILTTLDHDAVPPKQWPESVRANAERAFLSFRG